MTSFRELSLKNAQFLEENKILYELNQQLKEVILLCNSLGFLTYTSQPGSKVRTRIYKTGYDRRINGEILCEDGERLQRAYIRGYMDCKMAQYIINELKEDKYLIVRAEGISNFIPDLEVKLGSVNFYKGSPIINFMQEDECKDGNESFNFDSCLHRNFEMVKESICKTLGITDVEKVEDIVEFDILETRWNNNDYLWEKLSILLTNYKKQI